MEVHSAFRCPAGGKVAVPLQLVQPVKVGPGAANGDIEGYSVADLYQIKVEVPGIMVLLHEAEAGVLPMDGPGIGDGVGTVGRYPVPAG